MSLRTLSQRCLDKGMAIRYQTHGDGQVHFPDWREAVFGGRAATYTRWDKVLYLNPNGLSQYSPYRPEVHELGHAVWFLLLTAKERYIDYMRLYGWGKFFRRLIPYGSEVPNVDESFAQDFEAYWTDDDPRDMAGWGRARFAASAPTRYAWFDKLMKRLVI